MNYTKIKKLLSVTLITDPIYLLAVCETSCENGGHCVAPSQCLCPTGFTGDSCDEDINECLMSPEVHKCGSESRCINKPGW